MGATLPRQVAGRKIETHNPAQCKRNTTAKIVTLAPGMGLTLRRVEEAQRNIHDGDSLKILAPSPDQMYCAISQHKGVALVLLPPQLPFIPTSTSVTARYSRRSPISPLTRKLSNCLIALC